MVGNAQPLQAEVGTCLGHGFECVLSVTGDGVVVETSADFPTGDQFR